MIEVVTSPADLADWDQNAVPFYLELFGETSPIVDMHFAETGAAAIPEKEQDAPIYEYWWTIGHGGLRSDSHPFWDQIAGTPAQLWEKLHDPAARVYMYFPIDGGWRIKELVATVKYLTPVREQHSLWEEAAKEWQQIQPVVAGVANVAGAVPGVGTGVKTAAGLLNTMAKLKVNSVPQGAGFEWSVEKVTFGSEHGVMQGLLWNLPKKMLTELGGRLTGSVAVSFIPARRQGAAALSAAPDLPPRAVLAHAVVATADGNIWNPGQREFAQLMVSPTRPPAGRSEPTDRLHAPSALDT